MTITPLRGPCALDVYCRSGGDSLLYSMAAKDLVVVASVLSIYGFVPPGSWPEQYIEAIQAKAGGMDARQVGIGTPWRAAYIRAPTYT